MFEQSCILAKKSKGQAVLEFALILPLLLLLIFGLVDISRVVYYKSLLNQAAKESLRMAAVGADLNAVSSTIMNLTEPLMGSVTSTISSGTDDQGNACTSVVLTPSAGYTLTAYITPVYYSGLATGQTLRVVLFYTIDYLTPLSGVFSESKSLQAAYYTRVESPPK